MTARSLALILIRVLAIKFLVETIAEILSQITMLQMMGQSPFGNDGTDGTNLLVVTIGIFVLGKALLAILLLIYSNKVADRIAGSNTEKLEAHPQLAATLTHIGILLIGLTTLIHNLPRFLTTAIQWFQAHANLPENVASQQNSAMAQVTLLFILSLFLLLRGKTLTRWLMRLSK
ncbi:hypothetical protein ACWPKO_13760 [Coraliomargarita sp. W4R53]